MSEFQSLIEPDQSEPEEQFSQGRQQPPSYPPQQETGYPQWQPPSQPLPPQQHQEQPPKKHKDGNAGIGCVSLLVILIALIIATAAGGSKDQSSSPTASTTPTVQATAQSTDTPTPEPTLPPQPTPTSVPTQTQAQIESDYKASTTSTTVINLDKDGSADQGKDVHFVSKILSFVKDSTGNTAGANVTTPDSYSGSVIRVVFTPGADITQLNEGDILEVWGSDAGVFSGTNAYGGTVQEVGIAASYMFDQTTNYHANT